MPVEEPKFQPERILEVLARHEVECVVIGGIAAYFHGSAFITEDVDVTPRTDIENYAKLSAALDELEAKIWAPRTDPLPFGHDARSLLDVAVWNLSTKFGRLDITTSPSGTGGYDDLRRDAVTIRVGTETISVASLADVVRSKGAAGRDKDMRTLPLLRELLAEQTKAEAESRRRKK